MSKGTIKIPITLADLVSMFEDKSIQKCYKSREIELKLVNFIIDDYEDLNELHGIIERELNAFNTAEFEQYTADESELDEKDEPSYMPRNEE